MNSFDMSCPRVAKYKFFLANVTLVALHLLVNAFDVFGKVVLAGERLGTFGALE